jgi:hypothetical protein
MAAVEDADAPAGGQGADDAPEEVVIKLLRTATAASFWTEWR